MKIGTLSFNINTHDYNYGAMLHSYAFLKYLERYDFIERAEIIDYISQAILDKEIKISVPESKKRNKFRDFITLNRMKYSYYKRHFKFKLFVKKYMNTSKKKYRGASIKDSMLDYDCLICESDVIWSALITGGKLDPAFLLAYPNMKDKLRIAYSPSLGNGIVDKTHENDLKKYLKGLDFISCRETYGVDILSKLTSKEVKHVLDPVFLLDDKDYSEIIGNRIINEKYIMLYLPVNNNPELRRYAKDYAKKHNYKIVEISTKLIRKKSDSEVIIPDAGIEEFLSALKYSECVFTNSFHAVCFSIIFKKEFYAFSRKYAKKVEDICKIFDLENRYFMDDNFKAQKNINWKNVYGLLKKYKKDSIEFIENALQR